MANLQFDQLHDVLPPPADPIREIGYIRNVDSRSVTFESGVTILFSDFMSGTFETYLSTPKEDWKGPIWLKEAWESTLETINSQHLGEQQALLVASFLLGQADHIVFYKSAGLA